MYIKTNITKNKIYKKIIFSNSIDRIIFRRYTGDKRRILFSHGGIQEND